MQSNYNIQQKLGETKGWIFVIGAYLWSLSPRSIHQNNDDPSSLYGDLAAYKMILETNTQWDVLVG